MGCGGDAKVVFHNEAIIDTKGKLAEYFLHRELDDLQKKKIISDLVWFDADGKPDFTFTFHGKPIRQGRRQ